MEGLAKYAANTHHLGLVLQGLAREKPEIKELATFKQVQSFLTEKRRPIDQEKVKNAKKSLKSVQDKLRAQ